MLHFSIPEGLADGLGVAHDRVGAEVGQVGGLRGRVPAQRQGLPVGRGAQPGAALVEQQDAEGLGGLGHPAVQRAGARGLAARAALQEEQPRQRRGVLVLGGDDLAGEHGDRFAGGFRVVKRDLEVVLGGVHAAEAAHAPAPSSASAAPSRRRTVQPSMEPAPSES